LRERADDIEPLIEHFLDTIGARWGAAMPRLSEDALALLKRYSWPGNVRELRNIIERMVATSEADVITAEDVPAHVRGATTPGLPFQRRHERDHDGPADALRKLDLRESLSAFEAKLIREALLSAGGNQRRAAELLNLPLRTLERKLQALAARKDEP
jgi:DNA-binding NtrC family response regulator